MKDHERKKKEKEALFARWWKTKEEKEKVQEQKKNDSPIQVAPEPKLEDSNKEPQREAEKKSIEQLLAPETKKETTPSPIIPTIEAPMIEKEIEKASIPIKEEKKEAVPRPEIPPLPKKTEPEKEQPKADPTDDSPKIKQEPKKEDQPTSLTPPPTLAPLPSKEKPLPSQEIKEQLLEDKVVREFERILKDSRFEMRQLILEYNLLAKEADALYETKEAEKMAEEMDLLLERLKKIKEQFKVFEESINFDKIFQLEDHYFTEAIEEYKKTVKEEHLIENQLNDFKRDPAYISIVEKIIEFESKEEKLEKKVKQRQEELELRDDKLDEMKENYLVLENFSDEMETIQKEQERMLYQIEEHLKESVDVTRRVEEQVKFSNHFLARHLMMLSLLHSIPTLQAAGIVAVTGAIIAQQMRNLLFPPKGPSKTIITYHINDYHEEIKNTIRDVTKITSALDEGIEQIQELKKDFEKEFEEYFHILPEFKELLGKMDEIEESLLEKQEDIDKIGKKLEASLGINDQKVYLYERQNNQNRETT